MIGSDSFNNAFHITSSFIVLGVSPKFSFNQYLNVFIVNFFFAINLVPSSVIFYSSVFLSIVGCSIISSKYFLVNSKFILFGVLSSCAIFILAKNNSQNFYDVSWDGQAYQLEAIIKMIEGWNPIKTQLDNSIKVENIFMDGKDLFSYFCYFYKLILY